MLVFPGIFLRFPPWQQNKPVINHFLRKESGSEISKMEAHCINQITCMITGRTCLDYWAVTSKSHTNSFPLGCVTMCVFILPLSIFSGIFLPWISVLLALLPQTASQTLSNIGMCVLPSVPLVLKPVAFSSNYSLNYSSAVLFLLIMFLLQVIFSFSIKAKSTILETSLELSYCSPAKKWQTCHHANNVFN